jgi:alpha-tubulin suppressor-like RCC1 family protein
MAVQKYPGRVLSKTPPTITPPVDGEGGSAPGVWTLSEALENEKAGTWPKPVLDRELYTWGLNSLGQLGQNNTISYSSPVQVGGVDWAQVNIDNATLAIKTDGSLWSWGYNAGGGLGNNSTLNTSSPTQVGALTDWAQIDVAQTAFSGGIKTEGTLYMWGLASFGRLGLNDTVWKSSPVQVGALTNWSQLSLGRGHSASIKTDGTLWTWGWGLHGALGQNISPTINRSSPVQVGALTTWSQVSAGDNFVAAIKTDGTLWTWGYNNAGQLGINGNFFASRSSPVQVGALTTWSQVSAGQVSVTAIKTDGTLWTWGYDNNGQLGQNNSIARSSPVQIGALTNWSQASCKNHVAAVKTDGTLWTWGQGTNGKLGQNSTINFSSPVQVGALSTWSQASAGYRETAAITKG